MQLGQLLAAPIDKEITLILRDKTCYSSQRLGIVLSSKVSSCSASNELSLVDIDFATSLAPPMVNDWRMEPFRLTSTNSVIGVIYCFFIFVCLVMVNIVSNDLLNGNLLSVDDVDATLGGNAVQLLSLEVVIDGICFDYISFYHNVVDGVGLLVTKHKT